MNCGICHEPTDLWEDGGVICEGCADKPRHRYYSTLRPPGMFAMPDGACLREVWGKPRTILGTSIRAYGWAEYPKPLSFDRVWHYDLMPDNEDEIQQFAKWCDENKR